ncbi:MAG TPA: toll/interleukin-1 receptor domain-containing protein [Terriglobales bacterium]|nr:toll/interleukin-1 receptor domain-containing protein [Terriglobales bacterium]
MPLTKSQRLTLMQEIAARLSGESADIVDTTLVEFGLPTSEQWDGSWSGYVLKHITKASDSVLIELAQHVGFEPEFVKAPPQTSVLVEAPFWKKRMFRLFLSHLASYRKYAADLQNELLAYGISAFVAHNDIEPTSEWQTQIEIALATCDGLVALLHEKFHESKWTDQEIGFAMGRQVPTFSVRLGETPYGFISKFQAFNGNGKAPVTVAGEIFDSFRKNKQTQQKMADVTVSMFEGAWSFGDAKRVMGYLEQLEIWEPSFSGRIETAATLNDQVEGSFGVPDRIKRLVKKWKGKV